MLDFFADWRPYRKQMYSLERQLVEKYGDRPFVLLGVNGDQQDVLQQLIQQGQVTWRCWAEGPGGPVSTAWEVTGIPCIYLIDQQGVVRRQFSGVPDENVLSEAIEGLVWETEQEGSTNKDGTATSAM